MGLSIMGALQAFACSSRQNERGLIIVCGLTISRL